MSVRLLAAALAGLLLSTTAQAADPSFSAHWNDGRAELNGYRLTVQRYGHARTGRAVAIYVTEPFSRSRRVKLDGPPRDPGDAVEVLKLNLVRDFRTGIYDYHTMVSLFAESATFTPLKIVFTSAEWCGQVHEELIPDRGTLAQRVSSYFEGESARRTLESPADGVHEDNLFLLCRGLRGPWLQPGEKRTVPFLASPFHRRLAHRPAAWSRATIERQVRPEIVQVPAGSFAVDVYFVRAGNGRVGRFDVERDHPRRIVRWRWTAPAGASDMGSADHAELTGTTRLDYWRANAPGDEHYLERIGLGAPARPD